MKTAMSFFTRVRLIFMLAVFLSSSMPVNVFAYDEEFLRTNNVLFWGGGGGVCTPATSAGSAGSKLGGSIPTLTGADNAEKIWNFLIGEGLSEEQAAGLMGNIYQEAQFEPDAEEGNGIGYGIVQWSFERRTALEDAAKEKSVDVSDLGFQLAFMVDEAKSPPLVDFHGLFEKYNASADDNVWDLLKEQDNIEDATTVFHDGYERSNDYKTHGSIQHRIDYANEVFEKFTGRSAASGGNTATGGECLGTTVANGDLIGLLLEYAHPEWHPNNSSGPVPPPKPAYAEVVKKLMAEDKWVGGDSQPGIDCGGFVSILLTQSGFEPEYNYGLDGGGAIPTQLQWIKENSDTWQEIGQGGDGFDVAQLKPGDVAISPNHTFMYVGEVPGFSSQYASASYLSWRAPMAGGADETATAGEYTWYGKR